MNNLQAANKLRLYSKNMIAYQSKLSGSMQFYSNRVKCDVKLLAIVRVIELNLLSLPLLDVLTTQIQLSSSAACYNARYCEKVT